MNQILFFAFGALALAVYAPTFFARFSQEQFIQPSEPAPVQIIGTATPASSGRMSLAADGRGHFRADITINGRQLTAIVDTGASAVVLRESDARRLGLAHSGQRADARVNTANGTVDAVRIHLNAVRVGTISVYNVEALVLPDSALSENLLGMTFLRQLRRFEVTQGRLFIEG